MRFLCAVLLGFWSLASAFAAPDPEHRFDPPWGFTAPEDDFTVAGIENVPDLHGDIVNPQLVVFFAGNQFMVVDDLIAGFRKLHPEVERIFVETLPPGILARQLETGSITIGAMKITHRPDVFAAGKSRMATLTSRFSRQETYACNRLAIMVAKGNPKKVQGLADLARPDLQVSMPNPAWEGVGQRIEDAYRKAGGESLVQAIMKTKVDAGTTYLTRIHHRQTPMRVLYGNSDAGPVWHTEVAFQQRIGNPIEGVAVPAEHNIIATYIAGQLIDAPHPQAAAQFMNYLMSDEAAAIYRKYEFLDRDQAPK